MTSWSDACSTSRWSSGADVISTFPSPRSPHAHEPTQEPSMLHRLRNMWQFANLAQYIDLFGDAINFDKDFDIEVRFHCARGISRCARYNPSNASGRGANPWSYVGRAAFAWHNSCEIPRLDVPAR